jgi:hypothetical protein
MDAYQRAYESRDADAAARLFSDDATYQWGPFGLDYDVLAVTDEIGIARWRANTSEMPLDGEGRR